MTVDKVNIIHYSLPVMTWIKLNEA